MRGGGVTNCDIATKVLTIQCPSNGIQRSFLQRQLRLMPVHLLIVEGVGLEDERALLGVEGEHHQVHPARRPHLQPRHHHHHHHQHPRLAFMR